MHILGCLDLSEKNRQQKDPTPVKSLFENTMGNPFFEILTETLQKNF